MFSGIRDLLLHPDAFFERVSHEEVNLIPPVLIVGGVAFFSLVPSLIPIFYSFTALSGYNRYLALGAMLQHFILCIAALPPIQWAIMALGTHYISRISGGKGSLAASFQNTGYAMSPMMISSIGTGILTLATLSFYHSTSPDIFYWGLSFSGIKSIITCVFFFWAVYLWILAVRYTHEFTFRKAAAVAVVPVVILVLLTTPLFPIIEAIRMAISLL